MKFSIKKRGDFSRQSFLGPNSQDVIERCVVGIVGLGGGGSHIAQQLAHLGFLNYVLFDKDKIEDSNLNRLVGGTEQDVIKGTLKVEIAKRTIRAIRPIANVETHETAWQENASALRRCDLVFGSLDGFDQRRQLEIVTRRYLQPLIDVGMDVVEAGNGTVEIGGQVIVSMPDDLCMCCMGFLNERNLTAEAQKYGDAGPNPQVVWSNGVLASTAVGHAVQIITDWSKNRAPSRYLCYRGSTGALEPHVRLKYAPTTCTHFPLAKIGDPRPLTL